MAELIRVTFRGKSPMHLNSTLYGGLLFIIYLLVYNKQRLNITDITRIFEIKKKSEAILNVLYQALRGSGQ